MEASMRSLSGAILLVLLSSTAPAQQPSGPNGDAARTGTPLWKPTGFERGDKSPVQALDEQRLQLHQAVMTGGVV